MTTFFFSSGKVYYIHDCREQTNYPASVQLWGIRLWILAFGWIWFFSWKNLLYVFKAGWWCVQQFITQSLPPISSDRITCGSHHQCENNFLPRDHSHEAWYLHLLIIGEEGDRESRESLPCGGGGGAGIVLLKLQIPNCHPQVIHVQTGSARGWMVWLGIILPCCIKSRSTWTRLPIWPSLTLPVLFHQLTWSNSVKPATKIPRSRCYTALCIKTLPQIPLAQFLFFLFFLLLFPSPSL